MSESAAKNLFLEMLDDNQLVVYLTHAGKPTCDDAMASVLTFRQYKVYEAVQKENETDEFPKFFDEMSLSESQRSSICTLVENRNFDLVDLFMDVYPNYSDEYQEWKNKMLSSGVAGSKIKMHPKPSNANSYSSLAVNGTRRDTSSTFTDVPNSLDVFEDFRSYKSEKPKRTTDADDTYSDSSDVTEVPVPSYSEPACSSETLLEAAKKTAVTLKADDSPSEDPLFVHPKVVEAVSSVRQQLDELTNQARRMLRFLENTQELARMSGADIDLFDMNTQIPSELDSVLSEVINECGFCKAGHPSNYCKKFPTLDERLDCLSQTTCMRCLKECGRTCEDEFCIYCDSSEHNVALCPCYEHRQFLKTLLAEAEGSSSGSDSVSILRF